MNTQELTDHEYALLESIYRHKESRPVRQRDLARVVGISLGMTNVILRKLAQKGWVVIRRINSRNIQYAVTPSGIDQISKKSFLFLKRTVRNVVFYKDMLDRLLAALKDRGYRAIVLVGKSDFDFIIAFLCQKHKLELIETQRPLRPEGATVMYAEDTASPSSGNGNQGTEEEIYLHDILIGR
ncbi:MAG TPA: MarR family transcriptional regulator [Spirochaetia bacterium]|nr:MarR family transcriptional regulator [Spirochaetia bacterium]